MTKISSLLLVGMLALFPLSVRAQDWTLPPTTGHAPAFWKDAPNWTWDQKNPYEVNGGAWSLWVQTDKDPTLTSTYTPMVAGKAYGYFFVWRLGDNANDPPYAYRDFLLSTKALDAQPDSGPAAVLRFKAPADGQYTVDFAGKANVQNFTAGNAHLTAYILSADGQTGTQLSSWDLNADKPGAFGGFPSAASYTAKVPLKKGDEFAVRIQTVNPGPASAGGSSFEFSHFTVHQEGG